MLTDRLDHKRPVIFQESSIASGDELELEVGEGTADGENNRVLNETTLSMTPHSCTTCITDEKLKDHRQFEDINTGRWGFSDTVALPCFHHQPSFHRSNTVILQIP